MGTRTLALRDILTAMAVLCASDQDGKPVFQSELTVRLLLGCGTSTLQNSMDRLKRNGFLIPGEGQWVYTPGRLTGNDDVMVPSYLVQGVAGGAGLFGWLSTSAQKLLSLLLVFHSVRAEKALPGGGSMTEKTAAFRIGLQDSYSGEAVHELRFVPAAVMEKLKDRKQAISELVWKGLLANADDVLDEARLDFQPGAFLLMNPAVIPHEAEFAAYLAKRFKVRAEAKRKTAENRARLSAMMAELMGRGGR